MSENKQVGQLLNNSQFEGAVLQSFADRPAIVSYVTQMGGQILLELGFIDGQRCAMVLLAHVLGCSIEKLYVDSQSVIDRQQLLTWCGLLWRRAQNEPLAYLVGQKEFYGSVFLVNHNVLIPRPESELLVEAGLDFIRCRPGMRVIDVGTGSGAVGLTIKRLAPEVDVCCVDVSDLALAVARRNCQNLGIEVELQQSDLLSDVSGCFDLIVANLPYITDQELATLPQDVIGYEPLLALKGGPSGCDLIFRLLQQVQDKLADSGQVMLEVGTGQVSLLRRWCQDHGWQVTRVLLDGAGHPRVFIVMRDGRPSDQT